MVAVALLLGTAAAATEDGASIYQDGRSDGPPIQARLAEGQLRFPATSFRCGSCHGVDGTGKREGANLVPPLTPQALAAPRPASADWPARPAYDDASLARAVTQGVDAAGRTLSTAMPRYDLSEPQQAALITYLRGLGGSNTAEAGISPTLIRIGTALPLSGPQVAEGQAVRQLLTAMLARDSETGIYGRRLELAVADTATGGTAAAVARLVTQEHVFALVATRLPADQGALDPEVPVIGDLDGAGTGGSRRVFRIAAPIADRVAVLLRQAEQCEGPNLRLAVIGPADGAGRDALSAPDPAVLRMVLDWHDLGRMGDAVSAAVAAGAQAILVLAPREAVAALRSAMLADEVTVPLLVPGQPNDDAIAGATVLPPAANRLGVRLAFAGLAPDQIDESRLRTVMPPRAGGEARSLLLYEAYASAVVFLEAVKQVGRRLDRAALVEAVEALHDVRTGVLPPISFGPNRHDGLSGAAVVGFAADGHATFLAPWQSAESLSRRDVGCRSADAPDR